MTGENWRPRLGSTPRQACRLRFFLPVFAFLFASWFRCFALPLSVFPLFFWFSRCRSFFWRVFLASTTRCFCPRTTSSSKGVFERTGPVHSPLPAFSLLCSHLCSALGCFPVKSRCWLSSVFVRPFNQYGLTGAMSTSSDRRLPRHTEHISQARQFKTQHSKKGSSSKNRRGKSRPASAPDSDRGIFVPRPAREGAPAVNMQPSQSYSKREDLDEAVQGLSNKVLQELQHHRHLLEGIPQQLFRAEVRAELRGGNQTDEPFSRRGYDVEAKTSANFGSGTQNDPSAAHPPLPQDLVRRVGVVIDG